MKILFVCNEYPPSPHGGIGTYTRFLAEALVKRGHRVVVAGLDVDVEKASSEELNGVTVWRFPQRGWRRFRLARIATFLFQRFALSWYVGRLCRVFKPDIVESYDWSGPLLSKPPEGKFVVRLHGAHSVHNTQDSLNLRGGRLLSWVENRNVQFADDLVAVSRFIEEKSSPVFQLAGKPVHVIYNGVDTRLFKPSTEVVRRNHHLLFVGRVHEHKGLDLLVRSFSIMLVAKPDLVLDVVGPDDSDYARSLKAGLDDEVRSRIRFHGRVPNHTLPAIYTTANLCLVPSRVEAFPIVPLEAMACGTPVVMSSLVAATEIIDHKVDGFIASPTQPDSFASCVIKALENQQEIEKMRGKCIARIRSSFSLEQIVADNEEFYVQCLQ